MRGAQKNAQESKVQHATWQQPRPAESKRAEVACGAGEAERSFIAAVANACLETGAHFDAQSVERLAHQLARSFDGGKVDLRAIPATDLEAMPAALWSLMDNHARQLGAAGIESVAMPISANAALEAQEPGKNPLSARLGLLKHMTSLLLEVTPPLPPLDKDKPVLLDLQGLVALKDLRIKPTAGLLVQADPLVRCRATEPFDIAAAPCWVQQPRADGTQGEPVALAYDAPVLQLPAAHMAAIAAPVGRQNTAQELHQCQVMRWLRRDGVFGSAAQAAETSAVALAGRHVALTPENASAFRQAVAAKPTAVFDYRKLGFQLLDCFNEMQPQPGRSQHRWFILDVTGSPLGLRLEAKFEGGKSKFTIRVCDPVSNKPKEFSFDKKEAKLPGWLGIVGNAEALQHRIVEANSPIAMMWEVSPNAAPPAEPFKHVWPPNDCPSIYPPDCGAVTMNVICVSGAATMAGYEEFAKEQLSPVGHMVWDESLFRVARRSYHEALARGRGDEARALLNACEPFLDAGLLNNFLLGQPQVTPEGLRVFRCGSQLAMRAGADPAVAAGYVASVCEHAGRMKPMPLRQLLLSWTSYDFANLPNLPPILHELGLARDVPAHDSVILSLQQECMYAYLAAVLQNPAVPDEVAMEVCASMDKAETEASVMAIRRGNPGGAAALLCTVLDNCQDERRQTMLRALGVSALQVLEALDAIPTDGNRAWAARIRAHLETPGALPAPDMQQTDIHTKGVLVDSEQGSRTVMLRLASRAGGLAQDGTEADRAIEGRRLLDKIDPASCFDSRQFGEAVREQLATMDLQHANLRHFALNLGDRLIEVELRASESEPRYSVAVWDANAGDVTFHFGNLDAVGGVGLGMWIPPRVLDSYAAEPTGSSIGMLRRWPPSAVAAPQGRPSEYFPKPGSRAHREVMTAGDAERTRTYLKDMIDRLKASENLKGEMDVLHQVRTGYRDAMVKGHTEVARAYFEFVMDLPSPLFHAAHKTVLLAGFVSGLAPESAYLGGIQESLRHGQLQVAVLFARFVIDSRFRLGAASTGSLLMAHESVDANGTGGMPMLHAICSGTQTPEDTPQLRRRQYETLNAFVAEIVKGGRLDLDKEDAACNARIGKVSAMSASLANDNPCASAAIACAIFEHARADRRDELMGRSGVTADQIEMALEDAVATDPEAQVWLDRMQGARRAAPTDEKESPEAPRLQRSRRAPRGPRAEVVMHLPQELPGAPALVAGTLVGIAGSPTKVNDLLLNAGLRVVHMDDPETVVCATPLNLRDAFMEASLPFPLRDRRIPGDAAYPGEELYLLPMNMLTSLGAMQVQTAVQSTAPTLAVQGIADAPPRIVAPRQAAQRANQRISQTPTATWTTAWMTRAVAPNGEVQRSFTATGAGGRQFYVPGVSYPHLHVGPGFVRWSNGNGGGRYLIDHGGRVHLDTIAELLREGVDPNAAAVLQAIVEQA